MLAYPNDGDPRYMAGSAVSLPMWRKLIDGVKFMLPGDVRPPEDDTELRRQRAPRGPTMRSLVKLALQCDSAEEMGKKLKRRFDRSYQRRGITSPGYRSTTETEVELHRLLAHDGPSTTVDQRCRFAHTISARRVDPQPR